MALVVTLIVLLILAGITINLLFGDTGLFNKAQQTEDAYKIGALRDQISTIILDWEMEKKIPNTTGDETIGTLDRLWDKFVEADIIDNIEEDIEQTGEDFYEITSNEGYVVEIIVNEDGTVEIGEIGKGDNLPPRIGEIESSSTSNSIHVEVSIKRSTGKVKLSYYYKKEGEAETSYKPVKEEVEELTADFTELEQNVIYNIKVVAKDDNGSTEKVINELTSELVGGTIRQVGDLEWNNGTATIKLETSETGANIVYQIGNIDGEWIPYSEEGISGLNHGDMVYVAISDGTNVSKENSFIIKDGTEPTVTITQGAVTTKSIQVSVNAEDNQWGMPESPTYNYYIKKSTEADYPTEASYTGTNTSYTFDNLSQTTSYDIKVTTEDKAENEGEREKKEISTGTIGGATGGLLTGNIVASSPSWTNGTASITLSKGTGVTNDLYVEWQKGSISGAWTTGTSVTGLKHNDIVYARLTDGVNYGKEANIIIKDGTNPQEATITLSATNANTGTTITATVTHKDNESGVNIVKCRWVYNTTAGNIGTTASKYTGGTFSDNGQKISLKATNPGTYYLHVLTVDKAGKLKETISKAITVKQLITEIKLNTTSINMPVGTTSNLTANITPSNASNKTLKWTSSNTAVATVNNGTITAKADGTTTITVDATDGSGKKATCKVTVTTWTLKTNDSVASVTLKNPASTSSPTVLKIENSSTPNVYASLVYNKPVKVGDEISVRYSCTRSNNSFYLDFWIRSGEMAYSQLYSTSNTTFTTTVQKASNTCEFRLFRSDVTSAGYYATVYIYDILINGNKVL